MRNNENVPPANALEWRIVWVKQKIYLEWHDKSVITRHAVIARAGA